MCSWFVDHSLAPARSHVAVEGPAEVLGPTPLTQADLTAERLAPRSHPADLTNSLLSISDYLWLFLFPLPAYLEVEKDSHTYTSLLGTQPASEGQLVFHSLCPAWCEPCSFASWGWFVPRFLVKLKVSWV